MAKNRIFVGPADVADGKALHVEGNVIVAAVTPGKAITVTATGLSLDTDASTVQNNRFLVADFNAAQGKLVTDDWLVGENMIAIAPRPGEKVNLLLATAQTVVAGVTPITRNGTGGTFKVATGADLGTDQVLAFARESLTTSGDQLVECVAK